ncbi:hypothetical protein K501DRAFT_285946 [Backusella circina FSU 941]|nr:hypothetical protein K501DRAFT_285946 [Backusella circina FSU 941]
MGLFYRGETTKKTFQPPRKRVHFDECDTPRHLFSTKTSRRAGQDVLYTEAQANPSKPKQLPHKSNLQLIRLEFETTNQLDSQMALASLRLPYTLGSPPKGTLQPPKKESASWPSYIFTPRHLYLTKH